MRSDGGKLSVATMNNGQNIEKEDELYTILNSSKKHNIFFALLEHIPKQKLLLGSIFFIFIFVAVIFFLFKKIDNPTLLVSPLHSKAKKETNDTTNRVNVNTKQIEVIGFLPSWMIAQNASMHIKDLSQIIYFGLGVNEDGEIIRYKEEGDPTLEWYYFTSEYFKQIKQAAQKNKTKVLVAFKIFDNKTIDILISNKTATQRFIKSCLALIKKHNLDGINLDFEYFTDSEFPTKKYLNPFLHSLSQALKQENPRFIISLDINATVMLSDRAYDLVRIGEEVDQVIVMAYDYHTISSSRSGPVAPLFANENEHSIQKSLNSLKGRVPSEKVIVGIPFYGYEWQTISFSPRSQTVSNTGALATYKRVLELLQNRTDVIKNWDSKALSPWLSYTQSGAIKQIYYEDKKSLAAKLEYVKDQKLEGIAIWALGYEGDSLALWDVIGRSKSDIAQKINEKRK